MDSKSSTSTCTSSADKQDPNTQPQNPAPGKTAPNVNPTSSTPTPTPTSVVQKYVTDAAEMISSLPDTRKQFLTEVTKMCLERAKAQEHGITSIKRPLMGVPMKTNYNNYSQGHTFRSESPRLQHRC